MQQRRLEAIETQNKMPPDDLRHQLLRLTLVTIKRYFMHKVFKCLAASLSVCVALAASPAIAQTVNTEEGLEHYANVRGWSVYLMGDGRGLFACRAVRGSDYNDQIMIEYNGFHGWDGERWFVLVQGNRTTFDGVGIKGAGAYYDNTVIDRQIAFGLPGQDGNSNAHARLHVESYELGLLKKSSRFGLAVNGETKRTWSLSGSTAAIIKVAECAEKRLGVESGLAASLSPTRTEVVAGIRTIS